VCTSEPPTSITSYAVPPLSKLGPVRSRLGLVPEFIGRKAKVALEGNKKGQGKWIQRQ
jgi:hypothetical protein